jgi:hypothetical protein
MAFLGELITFSCHPGVLYSGTVLSLLLVPFKKYLEESASALFLILSPS